MAQIDESEKILDTVFWHRQIAAVVAGILCGIAPIHGVLGFLMFGLIAVLGVMQLDKGLYANHITITSADVLKEGLSNALGVFLALWVLLYTQLHSDL
eukprot:m.185896 g.185896  ORF g.185896 m.185896 type:complete len:98 (+) comp14742_c0_seq2:134-427(+)